MKVKDLPEVIQSHLVGYTSDGANLRTESYADVFHYTHPTKQNLFLKVRDAIIAPQEPDLRSETIAMSWLEGKLNVPSVICFHEEYEAQYVVMTQIEGDSGIHQNAMDDVPNLIREFASGLRQIHSISTDSCPLDWRTERYISWTEGLIEMGALDYQMPAGKTRTFLKRELSSIKASLPAAEDLVFTHGDYCLPNILIQDGRLRGIIDWGYAGIGDRYRDFVSAYYTIRRNLGTEWVPMFFEAYGLQDLDWNKLTVYQKVHDFID